MCVHACGGAYMCVHACGGAYMCVHACGGVDVHVCAYMGGRGDMAHACTATWGMVPLHASITA